MRARIEMIACACVNCMGAYGCMRVCVGMCVWVGGCGYVGVCGCAGVWVGVGVCGCVGGCGCVRVCDIKIKKPRGFSARLLLIAFLSPSSHELPAKYIPAGSGRLLWRPL